MDETQNPALHEMATVVFTVAPLPSGYSKDVHGTVSTAIALLLLV